jgi:hypothetical protein
MADHVCGMEREVSPLAGRRQACSVAFRAQSLCVFSLDGTWVWFVRLTETRQQKTVPSNSRSQCSWWSVLYIRTHAYSSTFIDSDVTLQVITAVVVKIYVFWNVTPCSFVEVYRLYRGWWCLSLRGRSNLIYPDDEGSRIFCEVGKPLPDNAASHRGREISSVVLMRDFCFSKQWTAAQRTCNILCLRNQNV